MKTDLFQSCSHCWVFQIGWHTECSTLTASSVRIWNSSAGIPSPPLASFVVTLPKDRLTLHSRMWSVEVWETSTRKYDRKLNFQNCLRKVFSPQAKMNKIGPPAKKKWNKIWNVLYSWGEEAGRRFSWAAGRELGLEVPRPAGRESEWVKSLSCVRLFATPWTVAYKAPLPMEFCRQEYWSGLPFPSPADLPRPRIEPGSPALQADALLSEPPGKPE